ncbi:YraN family protein [Hydrogenibacillus sp. N12]|uniref:YraN family protein n=1 Tax=Hydrogenibacillus sp. N12 TaxID=2866627 RepID=UPI001C7DE016|nr:YraN family protein [Hydrogenibacillus sp. N12]QZA33481.1 YraN family protein [Hydrogenibacillus sp. N12]
MKAGGGGGARRPADARRTGSVPSKNSAPRGDLEPRGASGSHGISGPPDVEPRDAAGSTGAGGSGPSDVRTLDRQALGALGEALALEHLVARGFRPIDRNVRTRYGEIDLIGEMDGCLVFVEVRTRRGTAFGTGRESVTGRKQARLRRLAAAYLARSGRGEVPVRFDVVEVTFAGGAAAIVHLAGAF